MAHCQKTIEKWPLELSHAIHRLRANDGQTNQSPLPFRILRIFSVAVWRSGRQRVQVVRSSGRTIAAMHGGQRRVPPALVEGEPPNEMCHLRLRPIFARSPDTSSLAVFKQHHALRQVYAIAGWLLCTGRQNQVTLPFRRSKHHLSPNDRR